MHVCAHTHLYLHILLEHLTKYLLAPSEAQIPRSVPTLNLRLEKVPEYNLSNVYNSPHPLGPAHGLYTLREASCGDLSPVSPALSRHTAVCALCSLFPALLLLHGFLKCFSCLFSLLGEQKPRLQRCLDAGSMLDKPATLSWLISLHLVVVSWCLHTSRPNSSCVLVPIPALFSSQLLEQGWACGGYSER